MTDKKKTDSPNPDRQIRMSEVGAYLGVSWRVLGRLRKEGKITGVRDPLDNRRRLVSVRELDELKRQSLSDSETDSGKD